MHGIELKLNAAAGYFATLLRAIWPQEIPRHAADVFKNQAIYYLVGYKSRKIQWAQMNTVKQRTVA